MKNKTKKLKEMMKSRKNKKIIYKQSGLMSGNPFITLKKKSKSVTKK